MRTFERTVLLAVSCCLAGGLMACPSPRPAPRNRTPPVAGSPSRPAARLTRVTPDEVARFLRLPASLRPERARFAGYVVDAHRIVDAFAKKHGWSARMRVFFPRGIEIFATQQALWRRVMGLYGKPLDTPLPTSGLSGGLEKGILLAVTPREYRRARPEYASPPGAYTRLLAHEIAHRLHVSILRGNDDAMGPAWFYEAFAVIVSGDLPSPPIDAATAWKHIRYKGRGAYRKWAAALRHFLTCTPLRTLVAWAGRKDFEARLRAACPARARAPRRVDCSVRIATREPFSWVQSWVE
jgi:hypothetical protein